MSLLTPGGTVLQALTLGITNWYPNTATSGTDVTNTANTLYYTSLYVPGQAFVTGVQFLIGSVGGTDKVIASICDIAGNLLANSAIAGVLVGTAANTMQVPLTTPRKLDGPNQYIVGLTFNGTTAHFRAIPAFTGSGLAGSVAQTFGTPANIVVPATPFTADKSPIISLY